MKVRAHLATRDGGKLSLIKLKAFCAQHLPVYMIPDAFSFHESSSQDLHGEDRLPDVS